MKNNELALTHEEYMEILHEIQNQPQWRSIADKEADYADGNQLDSELLQRQKELGIPPAIEDLISPTLLSIQGYETNTRTDWRLTSGDGEHGQEVADALNYKLNQAERLSRADRACSDAFRSQIAVGIGWVEVAREQNPLKFPYTCRYIHRNEIHWDMLSTCPDLSDARWLRRQRWIHYDKIRLAFPDFNETILNEMLNGYEDVEIDGGNSTGLSNSWGVRFSTIKEEHFYNRHTKEVCISELWYKRWVKTTFLKSPTGKVVEYNAGNPNHDILISSNKVEVITANIPKMRRSYWIGDKCLLDTETPYPHQNFPYVLFIGFREDLTGIPYGLVRGMKYAQDSLNSANAKLRWGMSVVRTERTKGAVDMTDAQLRRQVARPDADIVLNREHMALAGSRFEVHRDYQLSQQHYQMLNDNRNTIRSVSGISQSFLGGGGATSGYQEAQRIEQSNQSLARLMDNFKDARTQIGELLLSLLIEDMGDRQQEIVIPPDTINEKRTIALNIPMIDEQTGLQFVENSITQTRLKVALEDVPQTQSYRSQQLTALSEAVKSLPPEYQTIALPYMINLMDMPYKDRIIEELNKVKQEQQAQQSPEMALKEREVAIKEKIADARIKALDAQAVQIGVQSAYAAMQSGATIAQMPQVAPIADEVMKSAGYTSPNPQGDDPNYPQPEPMPVAENTEQNTNPTYPPAVRRIGLGLMRGVRTRSFDDNTRF